MDIPSSLTSLIGQRILRLATSHNGEIFFLDINKVREFGNRTRFGVICESGEILKSENLAPLLGNILLDVFDGGVDSETGAEKLVFVSNPTSQELEYTILFFIGGPVTLQTEDEEDILTEDEEMLLVSEDTTVELEDYLIGKLTFGNIDSENKQFIVQEDDFIRETL
jgi:hypothetical protein